MPSKRIRLHHWPSLLIITSYLFLLSTSTTDADLFDSHVIRGNTLHATTLEFSGNDTASLRPQISLFNLSGIVPHGFKTSSLKLKNTGETNLKINSSVRILPNQEGLCPYLSIKVVDLSLKSLYLGQLNQFNLKLDLPQNATQDLIFILSSLEEITDSATSTCDFDIIFTSLDSSTVGGFYDQKVIQNHVQTSLY